MKILNKGFLYLLITLFSCQKSSTVEISNEKMKFDQFDTILKTKIPNSVNINGKECSIDSLNMQTSEFNGTRFFTENNLRGSGVLNISFEKTVEILNLDKSNFGKIIIKNNALGISLDVKLPKTVIAREVMPDPEFQVFSFDGEIPETDKNFLIIYVNKEKRLIDKKTVKYDFLSWENYIKSSYIQLDSSFDYLSKSEQKYWYEMIKIKNDSMQIKSINKTKCDYIENYKDVTKWVKWKQNNCKLIKFNFCY